MQKRPINLLLMLSNIPLDGKVFNKLRTHIPSKFPNVKLHEAQFHKENQLTSSTFPQEILESIDITINSYNRRSYKQSMDHLKNLRWMHSLYVGMDEILKPEIVDVINKRNIIFTNSSGISNVQLAEFAILSCLYFAKRMPFFLKIKEEKKWEKTMTSNISNKTLLIVGLGGVGTTLAKMAKNGFNMKVIAVKKHIENYEKPKEVDEIHSLEKLKELLPQADFVVNTLPLTKETEKLFKKEHFDVMKPSSVFVNTGRGATVVESDLIEALRSDKILGAGLDVFEKEPLPVTSPLYCDEKVKSKVLLTTHCVDRSEEIVDVSVKIIEENLKLFINGEPLKNVVNLKDGY